MKVHEVRKAVLASGHVKSLQGLEDGSGDYPLVQFEGVLTSGRNFSVRISQWSVGLEVRMPDDFRDQTVLSEHSKFPGRSESGAQSLARGLQAILPWLDKLEGAFSAAPAPEKIGGVELQRIQRASAEFAEASARKDAAFQEWRDKDDGPSEQAYAQSKVAFDEVGSRLKEAYFAVYTWDGKESA
jgi:hypothetical protein